MTETQVWPLFACFILFPSASFFPFVHLHIPVFFLHLYIFSSRLFIHDYWRKSSLCLRSIPFVSDDRGFAEPRVQHFNSPLSSSSPMHGTGHR